MPKIVRKHLAPILVAAIALLSIGLRVAACHLSNRVDKDSVQYIRMAEDIGAQDERVAFSRNSRMAPLYPYAMAGLRRFGLDVETGGQIISVAAGVLLVLLVGALAREFFGRTAGFAAAFICATHPTLVLTSTEVMRDSLFLALLFASLLLAVQAARRFNSWKWLAAGALCALTTATRTEGFELLLALLAWAAVGWVLAFVRLPAWLPPPSSAGGGEGRLSLRDSELANIPILPPGILAVFQERARSIFPICDKQVTPKTGERPAALRGGAAWLHPLCRSSLEYFNILIHRSLRLGPWRSRQNGILESSESLKPRLSILTAALLFTMAFAAVSEPLRMRIGAEGSEWSAVDPRITKIINSFITSTKEEVLEAEVSK